MPVFPFSDYWWFYVAFTAVVCLLLALDLLLHRKPKPVSFKNALGWTGIWLSLALLFGLGLYAFASQKVGPDAARQLGLEFLAAYVVEESLSVDNMFVFALLFRYFAIPGELHHRVLFYGVLGALVFRAIFIAIGVAVLRFHFILVVMGLFLIYTGLRIALQRDEAVHPGDNPVVRLARKLFPVTRELHGAKFFVSQSGVRAMTPLFLVVLVLETTDVVFAIDSVPAVLAISSEPLVVYTSNVLAILGLRSLYFVLAGAMDRFYTLKYALAAILVFVGLKMAWLDEALGGRVPIGISLAFITGALALGTLVALVFPKRPEPAVVESAVPHGSKRGRGINTEPAVMTGAVCLLLSCASILLAAGVLEGPVPEAIARAKIPSRSVLISAAGWFATGAALIAGGRHRRGAKRLWARSRHGIAVAIGRRQGA